MHRPNKISIIITTYNRSSALELVLRALSAQDISGFEVLIADDGSDEKTHHLISQLSKIAHFPIQHIWQRNKGFRAAKIRNKAASKASGDYLIFLDGDCVPQTSFVRRHIHLAEKSWFVSGNRILLNPALTEHVTAQLQPIQSRSHAFWAVAKLKGQINRLLPLYYLPLGMLRKRNAQKWKGAKTCNLAIWKKDFFNVNGFNESYQGWGYEDSDLVIRLIRAGVKRKMGQFCVPVFHLWHQKESSAQQKDNYRRLTAILESADIKAKDGVAQY